MKIKTTNKGFSLIEVLVCIALIALICVPLFASFRVSATLNHKAHYTQKVTAAAQEELERLKTRSVEDYIASFLSEGGSEVPDGDEEKVALQNKANMIKSSFSPASALTPEKEKELFTPILLEKEHIQISGKTYRMRVKMMPADYSNYSEKVNASGVNVAGYFDTAQADAERYAVISDQINLYDTTCVEILREKLVELDIKGKTDADILANLKKTVHVEIESSTAAKETKVRCDVTYSYPASSPKVETEFNVYQGTYVLDPVVDSEELKIGEKSGGNVFIMARAYQGSGTSIVNELDVNSTGDGNVDVYFVLGREKGAIDTDRTMYNFNHITVNGAPYSTDYHVTTGMIPGEMAIAGTGGTFKTNVRMNGVILNDSTGENTDVIGNESYRAITYAVEIDLFDETDGNKRVAHLEGTKINSK